MTPMIDIVFLLIIFFLVSSHLSRQETRRPVTLSLAAGGELPANDAATLTLTVDKSGEFFFIGESIRMADLPERLTLYLQTREQSLAREIKARLRIDRRVPYGDVEPILKELASHGIADVSIVVNPS